MRIKIWNYRSYPINSPIAIEIKEGITFVLGVNNIGKSNLLRFFYDFRNIFNSYRHVGYDRQTFPHTASFLFDNIITNHTDVTEIQFETSLKNESIHFTIVPQSAESHTPNLLVTVVHKGYNIYETEGPSFINKIADLFQDTFYIGSNRVALQNTSGTNYDITIGQDFINTWISWADGQDVSKRKKMANLVSELKELFNYTTFNIRVNAERNNLIITTDGGEFLLTEMGSGISHFIVVLANVLVKQPSLVLIDEPEQNLHPKMQEVFVRALSSKTKYGVLATSHSVGLARAVADKIYSLTSLNGRPKLTEFGNHYNPTISQTISEMSYSQFIEIGGDNILLVEGRTDIKSFREILRKYEIENRFIIIPFGGRQFMTTDKSKIIDELSELKRLNANSVSVIFDSERTKENSSLKKEFQTFIAVCKELDYIVFPTDRHSTENYISQKAIDKVLGSHIQALKPFENFSERTENQKWPKEKNWLMFLEMEKDEFLGTQLDSFIKETLISLVSNKNI